jgi:hypothetical protein
MNSSATSKMTKSTATAAAAAPAKTVKKADAKVDAKAAAPAKTVAKTETKVAKAEVKPVVAAQPVAEVAAVAEITWNEELKTLQTTVEAQITTLKSVLANLKRVEKRFAKEMKDAKKKRKVARKLNADGTPAVVPIQKPKAISDELGLFLGKGKNATASRSEVTKALCAYVKQKGLGNGRFIKADAPLLKLFGISASDELTYIGIQKHINKHFVKTA